MNSSIPLTADGVESTILIWPSEASRIPLLNMLSMTSLLRAKIHRCAWKTCPLTWKVQIIFKSGLRDWIDWAQPHLHQIADPHVKPPEFVASQTKYGEENRPFLYHLVSYFLTSTWSMMQQCFRIEQTYQNFCIRMNPISVKRLESISNGHRSFWS